MEKQVSNLKYIRAKTKVERVKGFYNHVFIYSVVNLVITGFKVKDNLQSWDSFTDELFGLDTLSVWLVWGLILGFHFLMFKFGQGWEDRKIEKLMHQELSNISKDDYHGKI